MDFPAAPASPEEKAAEASALVAAAAGLREMIREIEERLSALGFPPVHGGH